MFFAFFSTILGLSLAVPSDYGILEPPSYFSKPVYRARVVDHSIELLDGPIILQNCDPYHFKMVTIADANKYITLPGSEPDGNCHYNCSICFSAFVRETVDPAEVLYDTITLEAHSEVFDVATTTIIIIQSSDYDPYKLVYNINGTEYVILNYFYFKLFLFLIIVTGIVLLVLEIREIIVKYRGKEYAHINDEIHVI